MTITAKELIEESGVIEETEEEIAGVRRLVWDLTNYDENLRYINSKLDILFTHIQEELKRLDELITKQKDLEETIKKSSVDLSGTPYYELYESSKIIKNSLYKIVGYLAIQLDVLTIALENLKGLIKDIRKFGIEKQRIDVEIEALKTLSSSIKTFLEQERLNKNEEMNLMRKGFFEMLETERKGIQEILKKFAETIATLVETKTGKVDVSSLEEKIETLEEKINLRERKAADFTEQKIEKITPIEEKRESAKIFESMERLVREEGITDKMEMIERLKEEGFENITPMRLSMLGFKKLVEKYSAIVDEGEEKVEEGENNI